MKRPAAALAAALALASPPGRAGPENPEWHEVVVPASSIELGLGQLGNAPAAAGNVFGSAERGPYAIAGFDWRGGALYDSPSATRWRLAGNQLGLDSRELRGEYGEQGRYRLRFDHDRLPGFPATEGYRTPFVGAGGTALILPAGLLRASASPLTGAAGLTAALRPFAAGSTRQRAGLSWSLALTPEWALSTSLREDRQNGSRLTGATLGSGGSSIAMLLPEPVRTTTRRFEAGLGYQKDGAHLRLAYSGALFRNDIDGWTFESPFSLANTQPLNRMGSAPDNQAHQIGVSGGYPLGRTTRLTGALAYGRQLQDATFLPYSTAAGSPVLPRDSLDGLVVIRRLNLKLTSRPLRDLRLNTAYKFDSRDNRTPVEHYTLPGLNGAGEVGAAGIVAANTPYSRRQRLGQVEGIYAVRPGSDLTLAVQREETARYCNGLPDCVEVGRARENTLRAEWREEFALGVAGRIGWRGAARRGDDYRRYAESVELAGMRKFFLADRQREQWRAGVNALLTETLSLGVDVDASRDRYDRSPYGLQAGDSQTANLDLSQTIGDDLSIAVFCGRENLRSRLASSYATTAPGNVTAEIPGAQWQARMDERIDTAGISLRHKGLLSGLLEVDADLVSVRARSPYAVFGGAALPASQQPQALPEVGSRSTELRLNVRYAIDDLSAWRFAYLYRRLASADFALDLYAPAMYARLLGTNETAPRYAAHLLGVSYLRSFR